MKKLLSIIMAIAMIAAMHPSAFATDPFEGYEYVFTNKVFGVTDGSNYVRSKLAEMTLDTPDSSLSHQWKVAGSNYLYNVYAQTEGIVWNGLTENAYSESEKQGKCAFAIEISVPTGGTYKPSLRYSAIKSAPIVDIYLVKKGTKAGDYSTDDIKFASSGNNYGSTSSFIKALDDTDKLGQINLWGNGSYTNKKTESFNDLELQLDGNSTYYLCFRTTGLDSNHTSSESKYSYACIESFKLTYVPSVADKAFDYTAEDHTTTSETTVKRFTYCNGTAKVIDENPITATYGTSVKIPAADKTITDESTGKTYNFLYWAKGLSTGLGNKNVLSTETGFGYLPQEGANYLIAVYEEADAAEETATFYNANGQLLTGTALDADGALPALPSMAGYTAPATAWVQLGTNDEFGADKLASEISGDKIFMAKYADSAKKSDISVTVNGASSDSTPTNTYAYGKEIICKAATPEGKVFMYWTKTVAGETEAEIVSMEENYSFYAWENCEVTAVYGEKQPSLAKDMRKIIISSVAAGEENAIMAEFIGFGDALEKGVMVGSRKIAMTTKEPQFTVVVGTGDTVTGYAIVKTDSGYEQITDK